MRDEPDAAFISPSLSVWVERASWIAVALFCGLAAFFVVAAYR